MLQMIQGVRCRAALVLYLVRSFKAISLIKFVHIEIHYFALFHYTSETRRTYDELMRRVVPAILSIVKGGGPWYGVKTGLNCQSRSKSGPFFSGWNEPERNNSNTRYIFDVLNTNDQILLHTQYA